MPEITSKPDDFLTIYNPEGISPPLGQYTHVARVKPSELLFIAGALSVNARGESVGEGDLYAQAKQIFANMRDTLASAGADFGNIVQFTTYLVSADLIPEFMEFRKKHFPEYFPDGKYPPNTLLIVQRLVHPEFLIEVQPIAALP
ncbi:enamine deaminase RidA (YjgF/YER057c/UK114 family) [Natronocella acetinitrilica]|uniref:Enamine deaminase RidA (YjgF/YER057c/UK114 family) n=1 Tax=Natronocella acetinitrilica TaxID=414046 RepID=A0AAE3G7S7_9GAMM|nr:RidA family protein [Natronocella acetinitrilica]MCP1677274.1 enamine deaminase RidA (YjgF/YER057c/UK114 family) [Natronocella acetinitrilica]